MELEQPVFGANYIKGKVRAQDNGQFVGEVKFKLLFKSGGAIDFAQAMLRAAHMAKSHSNNAPPPPYTPPTGPWHEAPPPAYSANPAGYYGWVPNTQAFPNGPPPNTVSQIIIILHMFFLNKHTNPLISCRYTCTIILPRIRALFHQLKVRRSSDQFFLGFETASYIILFITNILNYI